MKKFFKDVIGEIKNPSEDANKVLDVIRRVIRIILFVSILSILIGFVSNLMTIISSEYISLRSFLGFEFGLKGFLSIGLKRVIDIIEIGIYIYFIVISTKCIRDKKFTNKKFFVVVLILLVVFNLTAKILGNWSWLTVIRSFMINVCMNAITLLAFYKFNDKVKEPKETNLLAISRIRNISIMGYLLFALSLIYEVIYLFIYFADNMKYAVSLLTQVEGAAFWVWLNIIFIASRAVGAVAMITILLFAIVGRFKYMDASKKIINFSLILLLINSISIIIGLLAIPTSFLYIMVFIISVNYINKNKAFDKLGTRILKNSLEKIKAGFNNYLSFKE